MQRSTLQQLTNGKDAAKASFGLNGALEREQYDAIRAFSNTVIKKWITLSSTPTEFAWWMKNRWEDAESSAAKSMGAALDCLLLEPSEFPNKVVALTKEGPKRITEKHRSQYPGKTVLSYDQLQEALGMANALLRSPHTSQGKDFKYCSKQVAVAEIFQDGYPFKGEFDLWTDRGEDISDVKSARDVSPVEFGKAFANFRYDLQATTYLTIARELGYDKRNFNFLCVKNEEPYTVKVYRFRPFDNSQHEAVYAGCQAQIKEAARTLSEALKTGFSDDLLWEDLTIPDWHVKNNKMASIRLLE